MLAEGAILFALLTPPPRDSLHRPEWYDVIDLVCLAAGDRRVVHDRWGYEIQLDILCGVIEETQSHLPLRGTIHD